MIGDIQTLQRRAAEALAAYRSAANLDFGAGVLLRLVEAAADALALYAGQNPRGTDGLRLLANLQLGARDWQAAARSLERC